MGTHVLAKKRSPDIKRRKSSLKRRNSLRSPDFVKPGRKDITKKASSPRRKNSLTSHSRRNSFSYTKRRSSSAARDLKRLQKIYSRPRINANDLCITAARLKKNSLQVPKIKRKKGMNEKISKMMEKRDKTPINQASFQNAVRLAGTHVLAGVSVQQACKLEKRTQKKQKRVISEVVEVSRQFTTNNKSPININTSILSPSRLMRSLRRKNSDNDFFKSNNQKIKITLPSSTKNE